MNISTTIKYLIPGNAENLAGELPHLDVVYKGIGDSNSVKSRNYIVNQRNVVYKSVALLCLSVFAALMIPPSIGLLPIVKILLVTYSVALTASTSYRFHEELSILFANKAEFQA
jgi:hypothetical protein